MKAATAARKPAKKTPADGDIAAALRAYEQRRIGRTGELVRQARQVGAVGQWSNPLACRLRDALLKYVVVRMQDRQLERAAGYVV